MPEMPEIQAHAERMARSLVGLALSQFQLLNFAGLKTFSPPPDGAVGSSVTAVRSQAKYLLLSFDNDHTHVVHLMQGGRLRFDAKMAAKPRNGIARWTFAPELHRTELNKTELHRTEQAWLLTEAGSERKAGIWVVDGSLGPLNQQEPLDRLAPQASELDRNQLADVLRANSMRLHGLLRSQKVISGLGRMLANETCYLAGLSPFANSAKLTEVEIDRLHAAIKRCLAEGLEHERTLDDIGKSSDRPSRVHNRGGEPCVGLDNEACEDTIASVTYRSYTVFYCPSRQTKGKLLANNTTSKFLK